MSRKIFFSSSVLLQDYRHNLFLRGELSEVEGQLVTLQDVTVASARLTRSRRNTSIKSTSTELGLDSSLDLSVLLSSSKLSLDLLGLLLGLDKLLVDNLLTLLLTNWLAVVGLVPLTEWGSVNLDNSRLGQGVGSDKLVVGRMEGNTNDTGLSSDVLRAPGEVTGFETKGTVLGVTATGTDRVNSLGADTGVGWLTAQLKLSLLSVSGDSSTGVRTFVTRITRDTHLDLSLS